MIDFNIISVTEKAIGFVFDGSEYTLKHDILLRPPYRLFKLNNEIQMKNFDYWLYTNTKGIINADIFDILKTTFINGMNSDIGGSSHHKLVENITDAVLDVLFDDGLAGAYAEHYEIECMTTSQLIDQIDSKNPDLIRILQVSQKRNDPVLQAAIAKYSIEPKIIGRKPTTQLDMAVKSSVFRRIKRI